MRTTLKASQRLARVLALGTFAAFCLGTPIWSASNPGQEAQKAAPSGKAAQTDNARGLAGQRVHIDPQTGKIRPAEPEEAAQISDQLKQLAGASSVKLKAVRQADGTVSVDLLGSLLEVSVARIGADGTVSYQCVTGMDEARSLVKSGVPAAPKAKEALDVE